jgi:hypothetical protein
LLYPLQVTSSFDTLLSLQGILNGTTNFILTQIQDHGMDFATALKKAQELGFAEKDPTADLEGLDMVRKGNILAALCYGAKLNNEDIPHFGISHLSPAVLTYAKKQDKTLRFVVDMKRSAEGLGTDCHSGTVPERSSAFTGEGRDQCRGYGLSGERSADLHWQRGRTISNGQCHSSGCPAGHHPEHLSASQRTYADDADSENKR